MLETKSFIISWINSQTVPVMVIGTKTLLDLVKNQNLIEGLAERELENPEGAVFDLQLGEISQLIEGKSFLGIDTRQTPESKTIATFDGKPGTIITIKSGEYYLTSTHETFNISEDLIAVIKPRSTLFRSGLMLRAGVVNPGYSGKLHFGLYNASGIDFEIEMGARFAQVFFMQVEGDLMRTYEGQWQGGRKSALNEEVQI